MGSVSCVNVTQNGDGVQIEIQGDNRTGVLTMFGRQSNLWPIINSWISHNHHVIVNPYNSEEVSYSGDGCTINIKKPPVKILAETVKKCLTENGFVMADDLDQIKLLEQEKYEHLRKDVIP